MKRITKEEKEDKRQKDEKRTKGERPIPRGIVRDQPGGKRKEEDGRGAAPSTAGRRDVGNARTLH